MWLLSPLSSIFYLFYLFLLFQFLLPVFLLPIYVTATVKLEKKEKCTLAIKKMRREKRKRGSQEWNALHFVLESIPSLKKKLWKKERKDSLTRGRKHTFLSHPFFLSLFFSSQPSSSLSFIHPLPPRFLSFRLSSSIFFYNSLTILFLPPSFVSFLDPLCF